MRIVGVSGLMCVFVMSVMLGIIEILVVFVLNAMMGVIRVRMGLGVVIVWLIIIWMVMIVRGVVLEMSLVFCVNRMLSSLMSVVNVKMDFMG